jgi:hypothetical protein
MPPQYYGDSVTFLYVDDIRTSLETHAFTVWYRGSFTFFICRWYLYLTGNTCLHGLLQVYIHILFYFGTSFR